MAKTSRDAWRHYHAWVGFFEAVETVVSGEALEAFIGLYKERKQLRQSFRRLVARGFIKESARGWKLTDEGARFFRLAKSDRATRKPPSWDGKWRLVSFDVPVDHNAERNMLRALLLEFDFQMLQKSVWVSPYAPEKKFIRALSDFELWPYCKLMMVDILEGDEELRSRFKLPSRSR